MLPNLSILSNDEISTFHKFLREKLHMSELIESLQKAKMSWQGNSLLKEIALNNILVGGKFRRLGWEGMQMDLIVNDPSCFDLHGSLMNSLLYMFFCRSSCKIRQQCIRTRKKEKTTKFKELTAHRLFNYKNLFSYKLYNLHKYNKNSKI